MPTTLFDQVFDHRVLAHRRAVAAGRVLDRRVGDGDSRDAVAAGRPTGVTATEATAA